MGRPVMPINTVFPVPVYQTTIDVEMSQAEIDFLYMQSFGNRPNSHKAHNSFVGYNDNDCILEHDNLQLLKQKLETCMFEFIEQYGIVKNYWYIGKSWITATGHDGNIGMHNHTHHGGILSGVVYIDAPENCGELVIINPYPFRDRIPFAKETEENKSYYKIKVNTGDVLIWPSSLNHTTEPNQNSAMRLSIAFDMFYVNNHFGVPPQEILDKIHGRS